MNTNQKIAKVQLSSRFRQLLVAILSVAFGTSMYIAMNSFMAGVNNIQTEITFTSMAHIKVFNDLTDDTSSILSAPKENNTVLMIHNNKNIQYTEGIKNVDEIKKKIFEIPEVNSVTVQLNETVFIRNGVAKANASLSGIDTVNENELFETASYMIEGSLSELDKRSDGIILGVNLARKIGVKTGNTVSVSTSHGISKTFKIIGIIETGSKGADMTRALVSIQTARQLFSKNKSYATDILVNTNDYNNANEVAKKVREITDYKVESWQEGNSQLVSSSILRDILAISVSLTILIVAGFGIYNIMNMTVNEKIKEIAILKAMGFNGKDVIEIFLTQSIVIGLIGGFIGVFLGNIIVQTLDVVPFKIATHNTLPVVYNPKDYVLSFCFGVIITLIAGYLPSRKASKVDPVEILRG
ncbi:lipoprotein-releasing system permease protein [Tenacibaculum sp. MAR_2009_124]|uniref:ABC transporter permease n=1 Tax=Tenacibaculum sp. MAR_2009_124 TaxID=1250059 RepID=UPI000898F096|nr:FtsX-like permease family protein [Tenacibaculum sp. MAR_2009_124]SEB46869.1 lipoprotein-releasing system permease protein [Tenacibaculum sp. MAR_2009_124]